MKNQTNLNRSDFGHKLRATAQMLVAADKGILAMDESNATCNARFAKLGIPQTDEARRDWRELIVTTPSLAEAISGVILFDETIRQKMKDDTPFLPAVVAAGFVPGIKVDAGAKAMAGHASEKITEGLDGLRGSRPGFGGNHGMALSPA